MADPALSSAVRSLGTEIARLHARIATLEQGSRTAGLKYSSVDGGALVVNDGTGVTRQVIGAQPDGTVTAVELNAAPPAAPAAPQVAAAIAALIVGWDGLLGGAAPLSDFLYTEVHVSATPGFTPSPATLQRTMQAGGIVTIAGLTPGATYYAALVGVNRSRVHSAPSPLASGVPLDTASTIAAGSIQQAQLGFTITSGSGVKVTFGASAPSSPATGDLWYDTGHGNQLNQWTGTAWTLYQLGGAALANGSVGTGQIAAGAVGSGQLGSGAVTAPALGSGAVGTPAIASGAVGSAQIADGSITGTDLGTGAVGTGNIASGAVGTGQIANGAVGTSQVSFTAAQIGGITTTVSTTAPPSPHANDLWFDTGNGGVLKQWSGSAWTLYQFGTGAIAAGSVTAALIAAGTITATQIAANTITAGQIQANTITAGQIAANTITASQIAAATITANQIASGTITAGQIQAGTITGSLIAANTITGSLIAANTITAGQIAAATITAGQIATGAITATQIASGTITAAQIAAGTISANLLAAGIVKAGIIDGTVVTGSTLQNSAANPRTSINPNGSISVTNAAGTVIFSIGPDGTMDWYTGTGALQTELQPGGTTLIYAGATGPQGWSFEPPSAPVLIGSLSSATSATTYAIPVGAAVAQGTQIMVWASCSGATSATAVTDSKGNTYTADSTVTANQQLQAFACASTATALATSDTITVTYAAANTQTKTILAAATPGLAGKDVASVTTSGTSAAPAATVTPGLPGDIVFAVIADAAAGGAPTAVADGWMPLGTIGTAPYLTAWYSTTSSTSPRTASATIVSAAWAAAVSAWKTPGATAAQAWSNLNSAGVANSTTGPTTAWSTSGSWALKVTSTGGGTWGATSPLFPAVAGQPMSMQASVYTPAALSAVQVGFNWYTAGGAFISSAAGDQGTFATGAGAVNLFTITGAVPPATATQAAFWVQEAAADAAGTTFSLDTVQVAGGLVYSLSPTGGIDRLGNTYQQGLQFTGLAGLTNVLSVQDYLGNVLAQIDGQGNLSGQTVNAAADVVLGGQSVTALLNSLPQGVISRAYTPPGPNWPSTAVGTTDTALLELDQVLSAGRAYRISVIPADFIPTTAATQYIANLRATTDGSTPTTATASLRQVVLQCSNAALNHVSPYMEVLPGNLAADTNYRLLLTARVQAGTFQFQQSLEMRIEDLGIFTAQEMANNGSAIGTGTSGVSAKGNHINTYYATATHTYYGATGTYGSGHYGKRSDNSILASGCQSNPSHAFLEGDQYSFAVFNATQIAADLAGATINSIQLRLNCNWSYYSTGMTAIVGWTSYVGSYGDPFIPGGGAHSNVTHYHIGAGQTLAQDLTAAGFGGFFQSSGATGIMIGPASSYTGFTDQNTYGSFNGVPSDHSKGPALIINFTKLALH